MRRKDGVFMLVHLPKNGGVTMIENTFIDQFMPAASGDFVKIYLYLLRCSQNGQADVTVSQIADALNYTESDVRRAMGYWQRMNMLALESEDGADAPSGTSAGTGMPVSGTAGASLSSGTGSTAPFSAATQGSAEYAAGADDGRNAGAKIMEFRPAARAAKEDIRRLLFVAENYLGRPLAQSEQRTLVYFLNDLGMDIDLIEYLLEYCISRNHPSFHYIEKVAQNWTQQGIRSVEQARREGSSVRKEYYTIFRALGIQDHAPTQIETEFMDRWLSEYSLPMDVILLACQRTILQIGKAQFSYTDSILKSWHENGVQSAADVQQLDRIHEETVRKVQSRQASAPRHAAAGGFVNFEHSGRDWDEIAMQVMNAQDEAASRKTQES